jgi:hypothetical protein
MCIRDSLCPFSYFVAAEATCSTYIFNENDDKEIFSPVPMYASGTAINPADNYATALCVSARDVGPLVPGQVWKMVQRITCLLDSSQTVQPVGSAGLQAAAAGLSSATKGAGRAGDVASPFMLGA